MRNQDLGVLVTSLEIFLGKGLTWLNLTEKDWINLSLKLPALNRI